MKAQIVASNAVQALISPEIQVQQNDQDMANSVFGLKIQNKSYSS